MSNPKTAAVARLPAAADAGSADLPRGQLGAASCDAAPPSSLPKCRAPARNPLGSNSAAEIQEGVSLLGLVPPENYAGGRKAPGGFSARRERHDQMFQLTAQGLPDAEVARRLGIAPETVRSARWRLRQAGDPRAVLRDAFGHAPRRHDWAAIAAMRAAGATLHEIARVHRCSTSTAHRIARLAR